MAPSRTPNKNSPIRSLVARNLRVARGELSQTELGRRAGVDPQQISKWERGIHTPSDDKLAAIASALELDLTWFYVDHTTEGAAA